MQQHPEPKRATSFLGTLLGRDEAPAPPPPPPPPQQGYAPQQGYPPQQAYPQYAPVGGGYGAPMGGGGGFLRNAMQTATGVAAGALAFEGIESLMHGFGHAAGYGGGQAFGGFEGGQRPVEEVVNNYYGDDRGESGGHAVSADERALGQQEDRDFGSLDSKSGRDSLYGAGDDASSSGDDSGLDSDTSVDDSSFDSGGDFGDDGSGGGDDGSFA
jgi:hypothetical protein